MDIKTFKNGLLELRKKLVKVGDFNYFPEGLEEILTFPDRDGYYSGSYGRFWGIVSKFPNFIIENSEVFERTFINEFDYSTLFDRIRNPKDILPCNVLKAVGGLNVSYKHFIDFEHFLDSEINRFFILANVSNQSKLPTDFPYDKILLENIKTSNIVEFVDVFNLVDNFMKLSAEQQATLFFHDYSYLTQNGHLKETDRLDAIKNIEENLDNMRIEDLIYSLFEENSDLTYLFNLNNFRGNRIIRQVVSNCFGDYIHLIKPKTVIDNHLELYLHNYLGKNPIWLKNYNNDYFVRSYLSDLFYNDFRSILQGKLLQVYHSDNTYNTKQYYINFMLSLIYDDETIKQNIEKYDNLVQVLGWERLTKYYDLKEIKAIVKKVRNNSFSSDFVKLYYKNTTKIQRFFL